MPDVFVYDAIPQPLRVQIIHIMREALQLPQGQERQTRQVYQAFHDVLCREYGLFSLVPDRTGRDNAQKTVEQFLLTTPEVERALDLVELAFRYFVNAPWESYSRPALEADEAIAELNFRFREHGVGYQFESGEIIRVDSQLLHAEAVKPALALLRQPQFAGANAEFVAAYEHYRHGRHKEAINEALKSIESTLKTIFAEHSWPHLPTDPAKRLLDVAFQRNLIPAYMQAHFSALRTTLEAGVPTLRNRDAAHGQGVEAIAVPPRIVAYALHLTAAAIVLLVESAQETAG